MTAVTLYILIGEKFKQTENDQAQHYIDQLKT